ncbi:MAG: DUF1761 domain-containing protein [Hyphomicrobiaceae bacterium]|nr:DUF1761 domain-containing protein [Hyphomicrobiaceae bacterium]
MAMQLLVGLNYWAVLLAAVASFVFGGVWYGGLSRQWMAAADLTEDEIRGEAGPSPWPFIVTFLAQVVMALMLAGIVLHLARAGIPVSLRSGMISAFCIWLGFIVTTLVVNHQFQMQKPMLTLIDGGHWLGVMLIQGAILGFMGMN